MNGILSIDVLDGAVPILVYALAAVALAVLLARRPTRRWALLVGGAVVAGALAAVGCWLVVEQWLDLFGVALGTTVWLWVAAAFSAIAVCIVAAVTRTRWWRRVLAAVSVPVFLLAAGIGINADFGLDRTVGDVLGMSAAKPIHLVKAAPAQLTTDADLWKTWHAPTGMPATGEMGRHDIPALASGFHARPAGIYLPPAALVPHPPRLPFVLMMMGQPGNPDPSFIGHVLDTYAAQHNGLAPIVVVADQLGPDMRDTRCVDSSLFGNVESYVTRDVTAWATQNLAITTDHRLWTVAGYSNGGVCALLYAVKHPGLFGHVLDVSGEEFPGAEHPSGTLSGVFHGDQAAYDADKPLLLLAHEHRPDLTAVFTAALDDSRYAAVARSAYGVARAAGITASLDLLPSGGHGARALVGGLTAAFPTLYPEIGLSAPPTLSALARG